LFFRDKAPFEVLQHKIIPDLIDLKTVHHNMVGKIPLRIWSAACSTGQEAYSTAMTLKEMLPDMNKFDIKIVGTDISDAAVAAASYGVYSKFEIERGLSPDKLNKYFEPCGSGWKIKDELRVLATFKKFNLFDNLQMLGKFDLVFCRNVAIYFSIDDRRKLFDRIAQVLHPHGSLIIGSSEYLTGICDKFEPHRHIKTVYYKLKKAAAGTASAGTGTLSSGVGRGSARPASTSAFTSASARLKSSLKSSAAVKPISASFSSRFGKSLQGTGIKK
jgi:chemotaxis protein methyltransferase CheR